MGFTSHQPVYHLLQRGEDTLFEWTTTAYFLLSGFDPVYCIDGNPMGEEDTEKTPLSIDPSNLLCLPGEMHFNFTAIYVRGLSLGRLRLWDAANYLNLRVLALNRFVRPFLLPAGTRISLEVSKLTRCISDATGVQISLIGEPCTPEGEPL